MDKKTPVTSESRALRNSDSGLSPAVGAVSYIQAATSKNTRRTYRSAIRHFERWGGLLPATEAVVIRYLLEHAEHLNPRTLSLRLTALRQWHRYQGFIDPTNGAAVRKTLTGITRLHGQPKRQARAFSLEDLERMIASLAGDGSLKPARDRALLLVGFCGAFRRSELAGLAVDHIVWEPEGVIITLPRSKTDQTGEGKIQGVTLQ